MMAEKPSKPGDLLAPERVDDLGILPLFSPDERDVAGSTTKSICHTAGQLHDSP